MGNTLKKNDRLKDKVIVVTGGTGILGGSFVNAIAASDGTVCILGRNDTVTGSVQLPS